ncbi:MAG: hypothetical protein D6740_10485 [Alphaproteobacteria bacterium]|nr:MAG: hypothetical protein D6740_10485 [Alphaproteobacteria bacterium]
MIVLLWAGLGGGPAAAAGCPQASDPEAARLLVAAIERRLPAELPAVLVEIRDNRGGTRQLLARYRPAAGDRDAGGWTVLVRNGAPVPPGRARKAAARLAKDGPPMSAAHIRRYLAGRIVSVRPPGPLSGTKDEKSGRWILRIAPLGAGSVVLKGEDLSSSLAAELVVRCRPDEKDAIVERSTLSLIAPRRLSWFVVLKDAHGRQRFGLDAKGHPVLLEEHLEAVVDPLILPSFRYVFTRIYRDHRFREDPPDGDS